MNAIHRPPMPSAHAPSAPSVNPALAQAVRQSLGAPDKTLSSLWFYDDEGSRLFQAIMALPEYYLTRTEHALLAKRVQEIFSGVDTENKALALIELGSGDGEKTLTLCQQLSQQHRFSFHPMDVSKHALEVLSERFAQHLPALEVHPICGDYFAHWPDIDATHRQVALFLGSNLGNLTHDEAVQLLRRIHGQLRAGDLLVLGLDLVKDPSVILAAYNDAQGITAAFNLNVLRHLNRELGMDFQLDAFKHYACYNPLDGAARSFLVSQCEQVVHSQVLQQDFTFHAGETIYTEQSQKYTDAMITRMTQESGFAFQHSIRDAQNQYALAIWQRLDADHKP